MQRILYEIVSDNHDEHNSEQGEQKDKPPPAHDSMQ